MMLRIASLRLAGAAMFLAGVVPAAAFAEPAPSPAGARAPAADGGGSAAHAATQVAAAPTVKGEEKICKSRVSTESRARMVKECKTRAEWKRAQDTEIW